MPILTEPKVDGRHLYRSCKPASRGGVTPSLTPPTQKPFLTEPKEVGDTVDLEEHELATGRPTEGMVKFTVVSGVLSGYQLLMKPVVYTEVTEAETVNQEGEWPTEEKSL